MNTVYIVDGLRTPIGKTGGILKEFLPEALGAAVLKGIIQKQHIQQDRIDMVLLGNAIGPGGNLSRVTLLEAGFPFSVPGLTLDFQCGSGLSAILMGMALIQSGQGEMIIAGGLESTSLAPKKQFHQRDPRYNPEQPFFDRAPFAPSEIGDPDMGVGAEMLAAQLGISREEMDRLALSSHRKAADARKKGLIAPWILPLEKDGQILEHDESLREGISEKLLSRMPAAFVPGGNVTAGNACLTHDGAAALLLASGDACRKFGLQPVAKVVSGCHVGVDPNRFPLAPVEAIKKLLDQTRLSIGEVDALEINEAFAAKILACCRQLDISPERINPLGGALAYGHPYGASGAIITLHLLASLASSGGKRGIAAIGVGGGVGTALMVERCLNHENL